MEAFMDIHGVPTNCLESINKNDFSVLKGGRKNNKSFRKNNWNQFKDSLRLEANNIFKSKTYDQTEFEQGSTEADYELEQLANMTRIPFQLERLMLWALLACLDCFLYYFTIIPLRVLHSIILKIRKRRMRSFSVSYNERIMAFLIIISYLILSELDTSKAYHRIKRQSSVKLYMLFSVLEMADKMLASIGQSLLAVLLSRKGLERSSHQRLLLLCMCILYLTSHGYVMVYQTVALNVAVNSYSNALITLLLSLQFAEIKASLFKKTDRESLFQLTISDLVERSQLILLLAIIALRNLVAKSRYDSSLIPNSWTLNATSSVVIGVLCGPMLTVLGSELLVDWIKHAYVIKFNRIRPQIYQKFLYLMCKDHSQGLNKLRERLGLPVPAHVLLFIVMMKPTLSQILCTSSFVAILQTTLILILGFFCLIILKITLHIGLIKWGQILRMTIHNSCSSTRNEFVPGEVTAGPVKIDHEVRRIIHQSLDEDDTKDEIKSDNMAINCFPITPTRSPQKSSKEIKCDDDFNRKTEHMTPTNLIDRKKRNLKGMHSLEGVSRYKMVSKRIW